MDSQLQVFPSATPASPQMTPPPPHLRTCIYRSRVHHRPTAERDFPVFVRRPLLHRWRSFLRVPSCLHLRRRRRFLFAVPIRQLLRRVRDICIAVGAAAAAPAGCADRCIGTFSCRRRGYSTVDCTAPLPCQDCNFEHALALGEGAVL